MRISFCLWEFRSILRLLPEDLNAYKEPPYSKAISQFQSIVNFETPASKIATLIETAKLIIQNIQDHWKGKMPEDKLVV